MDESVYQVKTDNFEGPLDVLLNLIEKKKMHISDVSLAAVTDEYVSYVRGNLENDLPNVTLFLSIAATLVLIKSKTLLGGGLSVDDDVVNAEHNLEERLKLLELLRNGTNSYQKSMRSPYMDFLKRRPIASQSFSPYESINLENIRSIANEMVDKLPEEKEKLPKVAIMRVMTLEEMIGKITKNINHIKGKTSFNKISQIGQMNDMSEREKKVSVIVSFLAVLELVRGGLMDAEQTNTYGDILCEPVISISNIG
jgi:segregation and condensation protein A